uniref:Uncharacterized protein n=1 Tax=Glossina pallidipes TaxID=7398 RepID=A0A1A9ZB27_GLOPL
MKSRHQKYRKKEETELLKWSPTPHDAIYLILKYKKKNLLNPATNIKISTKNIGILRLHFSIILFVVALLNKTDDPAVNWDEIRHNELKDELRLPYLKKLDC